MDDPAVMMIKNSSATHVAVTGPMTIARIGEIRDGLLEAFALGQKVQLSLEGVTEVDLTGLQLICSAHRTSIASNLELSISGCQETIAAVAELSGMPRHTGCAQDLEGSCVWKRVA